MATATVASRLRFSLLRHRPTDPVTLDAPLPRSLTRFTPHDLHDAIRSSGIVRVREVLEGGVDASAMVRGAAPVSVAVYLGKAAILELLLDPSKADILCANIRQRATDRNGRTEHECVAAQELTQAGEASKGTYAKLDKALTVVDVGIRPRWTVDVNVISRDDCNRQESPLHAAVRLHDDPAVSLLLAHGADVDQLSVCGITALYESVRQRSTMGFRLIQWGASVSRGADWRRQPVFEALRTRRSAQTVRVLIYNGADPCDIADEPFTEQRRAWCRFIQSAQVMSALSDAGYRFCANFAMIEVDAVDPQGSARDECLRACLLAPPSLRLVCVTAVRRAVSRVCGGCHFLARLDELPLPASVIGQLRMDR